MFEDDPIQIYLREVTTLPPLTQDEEMALTRHVLANDEEAESASRRLVEANLAMVISTAKRHPRGNMELLDLLQKGNEGLFLALKTLRDYPNRSFSTHGAVCAEEVIRKAISESE